ncbi:hypothetical protein PSAC2689_180018 [Paraburkholderia sacchari]
MRMATAGNAGWDVSFVTRLSQEMNHPTDELVHVRSGQLTYIRLRMPMRTGRIPGVGKSIERDLPNACRSRIRRRRRRDRLL